MENAIESPSYQKLGKELINEMPELAYIKASECTIAYLVSDEIKKKGKEPVMAEVERIPDKYKWGLQADFSITIYSPNVALMNSRQHKILLFQQLLRLAIDYDESTNQEKYSIRDYDVNDFAIIIKKYGTGWKNTQPELFNDEE